MSLQTVLVFRDTCSYIIMFGSSFLIGAAQKSVEVNGRTLIDISRFWIRPITVRQNTEGSSKFLMVITSKKENEKLIILGKFKWEVNGA